MIRTGFARFSGVWLALALLFATATALFQGPAFAQPGQQANDAAPSTNASTDASTDANERAAASQADDAGSEAGAIPDATAPLSYASAAAYAAGMAPMPGNAQVPQKWLPPGSDVDDRGPSTAIFPPQKQTIRFNHKFHVGDQKLACKTCHPNALTSQSVNDRLTPKGTTCDGCHGTDHANPNKVEPGDEDNGKCNFCHVGYREGEGNRVARFEIPRPNMVFDHKKHADRNIGCQQCHGDVQELELATRDQMPRMRGCFNCHQHPDSASRGQAKSACETCHLKGGSAIGGRIKTVFPSGVMEPPRWMHNAEHTPDFIQRHRQVAADDSQFCGNCHKEDFCVACHDGRVRPRSVHPNDYLNMHPVEARLATQRCTSCHREQSFCITCHQRLGVSMSGPTAVRDSGRFHPPKAEWSDAPRRGGHHAYEAMRNLNACVSCHIERDCVVCHGAQGVGAGFNPHSAGFIGGCGTQLRRNPRPCYVCHEPSDSVLQRCR